MGILREPAAMVKALNLPTGFSVCELGDQWMSGLKQPQLAADWYRSLGCGRYVSIDGNGKGSMTWDLNAPIRPLPPAFDLVTDFGTGEHIFDQAQVWRSLHELAKPGGYIVVDRPTQGYADHCFYTIAVSLIEDVARANGYAILRLETARTPRGTLVRAVLMTSQQSHAFRVPHQGRYQSSLRLPRVEHPDG